MCDGQLTMYRRNIWNTWKEGLKKVEFKWKKIKLVQKRELQILWEVGPEFYHCPMITDESNFRVTKSLSIFTARIRSWAEPLSAWHQNEYIAILLVCLWCTASCFSKKGTVFWTTYQFCVLQEQGLDCPTSINVT